MEGAPMSTYSEMTERAQAICNHLNGDNVFEGAHYGVDNYAWIAEKGLATLLGDDVLIHAWIEMTELKRIDREGTIFVLTPHHLLTAEYGPNKHGAARIEPLHHTALHVEVQWLEAEELPEGRPTRAALTVHRPDGALTLSARNQSFDETRVERLLEGIEYLKTSMSPLTTPAPAPAI